LYLLKIRSVILFTFFCSLGFTQVASVNLSQLEMQIDSLSISLLGAQSTQENQNAFREVNELLLLASQHPDFANYPFTNLKAFVIVKHARFSIFTSMALLGDERVYYGGIFLNSPKKWIPLVQQDTDFQYFNSMESEAASWYGALYYDYYTFKCKRKEYFVLFGQREMDDVTAAKFADILVIQDEEISFGLPVFKDDLQGKIHHKYLVTYAKEAPIKFNYDPLESKIVFDHLIPMRSMYDSSRLVMVPDGSYSAFKLKRGWWVFESMLPVVPMDEAPRTQPVLDTRKNKDILGRPTQKDANRTPPDSSQ